ncbi:hypothetical protein Poli38472_010407 [Pythium oligandrum]|uniref:Ribosomal protein S21 n=1 Tax=Pythium oligandrum TaxID=41045 RepID=A0A8K1C305_PYTOL|nr:hypothetical protein Poli38472_010407 [Pythium oligandrum]|eukprot:TMW55525.1 hypothetical protein Poli38472_010407 [Pythium oligandrum]
MLSTIAKRATRVAQPQGARNIYIQVRSNQDPERVTSRVHGIMNEDGVLKSLALKRFHEKGARRRKRKMEEQTIRHVNRRIGSMIDFILKRKKAGF